MNTTLFSPLKKYFSVCRSFSLFAVLFFTCSANVKAHTSFSIETLLSTEATTSTYTSTLPGSQRAWFVKKGVNSGDTSSTIDAAIIKAASNDTILIYPGTYTESIDVKDKSLVIASSFIRSNRTDAIKETIIDGTGITNNFIRNSTNTWNGTNVTIIGLTIQNFQNQLNSNSEFKLKFFNSIFKSSGGNDNFLITNWGIEIKNCEFNSNTGKFNFNAWDASRKFILENNKVINHNLGSNYMMGDGTGLIEISGRGVYSLTNNLFYNCSGTSNNYVVRSSLNETDSLNIINNSFLNNDINVLRSSSVTNVLFQNNLLNSNARNSNSELSFGAKTKIRFIRNVTFQSLNKYTGFSQVDTTGSAINFVFQDLKLVNKTDANSSLDKYYPSSKSPFLGLGRIEKSPVTDLDGTIRPSPAGSAPEIGAFESNLSLVPPILNALEATQTKINISWTRYKGEKDDKINIFRSTTGNTNSWSKISTVSVNDGDSFIDSNQVVVGTRYFYTISMVGVNGDTSLFSNALSVTPVSTPPSIPVNIKASSSPSRIRVYWDKVNSVDTITYNIYRSVSGTGQFNLYQTGIVDNFFVDTAVTRGQDYAYKVRSVNTQNNASELSAAVSISTSGRRWFVSNKGDNADIGSQEYPFLTIANALKNAYTGDSIILNKGVYTSADNYVIDSAVTIMSLFPLNADSSFLKSTIIDGEGMSTTRPMFSGATAKMTFSGLTFRNFPFRFMSDEKQLIIEKSNLENISYNNNDSWTPNFNLGNNSVLRENTFKNIYGSFRSAATVNIESNKFIFTNIYNWEPKIRIESYSYSGNRNKIFLVNNLFLYDRKLIQVNMNASADSIFIINNSFIYKGTSGVGTGVGTDYYSIQFNNQNYKAVMRNNIFYPKNNLSFGAFNQSSSNVHFYATNNIITEPFGVSTDFKYFNIKDTSSNIISSNPGFVNAAADNYDLANTSIALGKGSLDKSPSKDIANNSRPQPVNSNPDLGAYENKYSIGTPILTTAEGADQRITLFWEQQLSDELDSFYVYRTGPNVDNTLQAVVPYARVGKEGVSFVDSVGIINKERYYYRIKSIDKKGNASEFSNLIIARANIQPAGITNLTANSSPGLVLLKWSHAESADIKFNIYRGLSSNSLSLVSNGVTNRSFIDTSINRAVTYYYAVKAVDTVGASSPFSEIREIKSTGRTWYVDTVKRTTSIGSRENPFNTVGNAMRYVASSDTIKILPGEYNEQLRIRTKPLFIVSTYDEAYNENAIKNTIINGSLLSTTSHLIVDSSNNASSFAEIVGITFKGAPSSVFDFSRVRFRKTVFTDNKASYNLFRGSYILMDSVRISNNGSTNSNINNNCCDFSRFGDSTIIRNSVIEGNIIRDNSILYFESYDSRKSISPLIESNVFRNNSSAWGSNVYAIRANSRNILVRNNLFVNNNLYAVSFNPNNYDNNPSYSNDFVHNTVVSNRGGVRIEGWNKGNVNIINNIIQNNQTQFLIESNVSNPVKVDFINNLIGLSGGKSVLKNITNIGNIDTSGSSGNFSGEFGFIDTASVNYNLSGTSAAIGSGNASRLTLVVDKEGRPRPNPENTNPDLGAFESPFSVSAPKLFSIEGSDKKTILSWDHSISSNKSKYYIYRATASIDTFSNVRPYDSTDATKSMFIDSIGITNLTKYYYRMTVADSAGNLSAFSNQLVVTPNKPLTPPDSLRIESAPWRLKVLWKDTTLKARSFNLYRGTTKDNLRLIKSDISSASFVDSTVEKQTLYYYMVKSVDSVGAVSDNSQIVSGSFERNIFYVDNNSLVEAFGSSQSPFTSIKSALQFARPGDTIVLSPSTYVERISLSNAVVLASKYILDNDTSHIGNTIISGSTIKNFTYLIGTTTSSYGYTYSSTINPTEFAGITFQDFTGGLIDLGNQTVRLKNSVVKNIISNNCNNLISLGSNSLIEKNKFFNNAGTIQLRSGTLVNQNEFNGNRSNCNNYLISVSDSKIKIQNNLFINNSITDLYLSGYDTNQVVHNTFYKKDMLSSTFIRFDSYNSSYNFIYNNIFSKKSGFDFEFNTIYNGDSSRSTLDISYNALGAKLTDIPNIGSYKSRSRNNFTGLRVAFRNADANNFILQKSSQAIGVGLDSSVLTKKDYFDLDRPNPKGTKPDLGAIESEVGIPGPEITVLKAANRTVSLGWKIVDTSNVANYRVYRSDTTNSPTVVFFESSTANVTSIVDTTGELGKTYYYRIKAVRRDSTTSDYSDTRSIKLYNPPIATKPLDNAYSQKLSDSIRWNSSGSNVIYDVELSRNNAFTEKDSSIVSDTFYVYKNLRNNTNYFYRLRARDSISTSAWSLPYKFQTLLEVPKFKSVGVAGDSVFFTYSFDTVNIASVKLYKSFDSTQTILYKESQNFIGYIDTLSNLKPAYFKFTITNKDNQVSGYSSSVSVITYPSPDLSYPSDGTTGLQLRPGFKWKKDSYSTLGNIQIARDSLFTNLHKSFQVGSDSLSLSDSSSLLPNTNYYWRVRVGDKNGFGKWSKFFRFQTFIEPPILSKINPGNKVDTLYWTLRGDSARYLKTYIYRDTIDNPTKLIDSTNGSTSVYVDNKNLLINKKYYYRLRVVNSENTISQYSATLSATPYNKAPRALGLTEKTFTNVGLFNKVRVTQTSTKSTDADGFIKKVKWYVNDELVNETDSTFVHYYSQGTNRVKLVVEDNDGDKDSTNTIITLKSFQTAFNGGILGGITAVSPDIIYAADSTYDPIKGAQVNRLDRTGKMTFPLIVSSKIFTTPSVSSDSSIFITSGSSLNGFDKSGAPLWPTIPLGGLSYVTPTIDSMLSRLYVGVSNKNFFAFDYRTGKSVWNILCDAPINASAVITGDRKLVFVSETGTLYGFDIKTDLKQTDPKWKLTLGETVYSSAAVDLNNDLYFGTNQGNVYKIRLNKDTGVSVVWKTRLDSAVYASPVIDAKGNLYVGTTSGKIFRINSSNGNIRWTHQTEGSIKSTPVITNNAAIVFANMKGNVVALDTLSKVIWKHAENTAISANLLYINNIVYVGTEKGNLIGIFNDPNSNSVNNDLSFGKMRLIVPEFEKTSKAAMHNTAIKGLDLGIINTQAQFGVGTEIAEEQPVWGTFQGNYRRTGSRALDCPDKPVLNKVGTVTICEGENLMLSSAKAANSSWLLNGVVLESTDTALQIKTQGTYKRMIKNDNGCTVFSDDVVVNINKAPEKPVISLNGKNVICEGESVQLSSSSSANNAWYKVGSSKIISTQQGAVIDSTGDYFVKVSAANGCSILSENISVRVVKKPEVPTIVSAAKEFCNGDSTLLTINGNLNTQWFFNGLAIYNANKSNYAVKNAGVYSVKVTSAEGCVANSAAIDISVKPTTEIPSIITSGLPLICKGSSLLLTATVNANNVWYRNGVKIGTGQYISVSDSGHYKVTAMRTNMCMSQSDSLKVVVSNPPAKPTVSLTGEAVVCEGSSPVLTSSSSSSNQWYKDGVLISGATGSTYKPTASGVFNVVYSQNGCLSDTSSGVRITVKPVPNVTLSASATSICVGSNAVLLANTESSGVKYQWYRDGSLISGATANSYNVTDSGSYAAKVVLDGCERQSSAVRIKVNKNPEKPTITRNQNELVSNYATGNQWYTVDGNPVSGATAQTFRPSTNGYYTVRTTIEGCASMNADAYFYLTTSLINFDNNQFVRMFPNPVRSVLSVEYQLNSVRYLNIRLLDAGGKQVTEFRKVRTGDKLNVNGLAKGAYIMMVTTADGKLLYNEKLVKE